ncbi:hypothetical protein VTP01DRAFT_1981 [Rhizomucor pusillus]|uniref:uncharacterized protein n=1 Tax=Rhizomucor pusillus TaxID=4840 RepID=UPI003742D06E
MPIPIFLHYYDFSSSSCLPFRSLLQGGPWIRYSGGFEVGRRQVRVSGSVCSPGAGVFQQLARAVSLGRLHLALRLGGRCKMACFGAKVAVSAAILVEGLHSGVDAPLCNVIKKVIPIQTLAFYNKIRSLAQQSEILGTKINISNLVASERALPKLERLNGLRAVDHLYEKLAFGGCRGQLRHIPEAIGCIFSWKAVHRRRVILAKMTTCPVLEIEHTVIVSATPKLKKKVKTLLPVSGSFGDVQPIQAVVIIWISP